MAIAELQFPTNFGIEDLYLSSNNNASFVLKNGERFGAASLMLGLHSPVLKEKYIKAAILDIDAVEFSHESVKSFVEAMYCGKLDITRENFREVNKICHVFNVMWMSRKCLQYFEHMFEPQNRDPVSDKDSQFLFDEAMYFCEHGQSGSLLEICRTKMEEEKFNRFTGTYLQTKSDLPNSTMEKLMGFTNDHTIFLNTIRGKISKMNPNLDHVSRYLLLNINLENYLDEHAQLIAEIFDILLENENSDDKIKRILKKLRRRVTREYTVRNNNAKRVCTESAAVGVPQYQSFSHLFNSNMVELKLEPSKYKALDKIAAISCNLYMVLEWIDYIANWYITDGIICKLIELKIKKGWNHVHPDFVDRLHSFGFMGEYMLENCKSLISSDDIVRVVSRKQPNKYIISNESTIYKFYMKRQQSCSKDSKCGFLVEVTGLSPESTNSFDIRLVLDKERYPIDMHFHESYTADKMYLAVEKSHYSEWEGTKSLSWLEKPEIDKDGNLANTPIEIWLEVEFPSRFVVYYRP